MKANRVLLLVGFSLLAMSNRCEKDAPDPCAPVAVVVKAVAGLSIPADCVLGAALELGQSQHQVITSAAQWRATFRCPDVPAVDFGASTLLTGQTRLTYSGQVVAQQVEQSCQGYTYRVTIQRGISPVLSTITYHAVVPKIADDATVALDVQILP